MTDGNTEYKVNKFIVSYRTRDKNDTSTNFNNLFNFPNTPPPHIWEKSIFTVRGWGGGGGEGIFWRGRGYMVFMGNGGDISRRQQSIKEGGQSKKGGGGGS